MTSPNLYIGVQGGDGAYSTKVDLSKFKKITTTGKTTASNANYYSGGFRISLYSNLTSPIKRMDFNTNSSEYNIDISDLTGEYYVGLFTHSATDYNDCEASKILLE